MIDINEQFNPYELELIREYPEQGFNTASDEFQKDLRVYNDLINKGILYNQYPDKFNNRNYVLCIMSYAGCFLQALVVEKARHHNEMSSYRTVIYESVYKKGYQEAIDKMGIAMAEMIGSHIGEPSCM